MTHGKPCVNMNVVGFVYKMGGHNQFVEKGKGRETKEREERKEREKEKKGREEEREKEIGVLTVRTRRTKK